MAVKKTNEPVVENVVENTAEQPSGCVNLDILCPVFLPYDEAKPETDQYEIVAVNGKNYQIARGMQVEVPYKVFEALYNSGRFKRL